MVANTAVPFSIFPRFGFTPSHKMESSSLSPHAEKPDEDWYIPYNGPFEPRKDVSIPKQLEDSFGYHVSQDDVKALLEDSRLLNRYRDVSVHTAGTVGLGPPPVQSTRIPGSRSRSDQTRRTTSSSSAIDPIYLHPQRSQTNVPRLQVVTHINTDPSGDVGESPMPIQRTTTSMPQKRTSRFFGFGTSKRPKGQPTSTPVSPVSRTTIPGVWFPNSIQHNTIQDNFRFAKHTTSSPNTDDQFDSHYSTIPPPSHSSHTHHYQPSVDNANRSPSKRHPLRYLNQRATSDKDSLLSSLAMNHNSPTILPAHPYADTSSSVSLQIPRPAISGFAPRTAISEQSHQEDQRPDSVSYSHYSQIPTHRGRTLTYAIDPRMQRARPLKSTVSTPNLSEIARSKQPAKPGTKSPPLATGIDRWLSPETWCDALFFPRPRLKIKGSHGRHGGSSERIVSPPATPISEGAPPRLSPALLGRPRVLSAATHGTPRTRILLNSKSTLSGRPRTAPTPQRLPDPETVPEISLKEREPVTSTVPQQELRLPSPVPSLTQ